MADLAARGDVDDAAFARLWVETRAARGYGPARLRTDLRARGVPATLIEAALSGVEGPGQLERARAVAHRRLPALQRAAPARAAARLRDYLLRRGFAGGVVARVVRECLDVGDEPGAGD